MYSVCNGYILIFVESKVSPLPASRLCSADAYQQDLLLLWLILICVVLLTRVWLLG